jgi:hypothetical protein
VGEEGSGNRGKANGIANTSQQGQDDDTLYCRPKLIAERGELKGDLRRCASKGLQGLDRRRVGCG